VHHKDIEKNAQNMFVKETAAMNFDHRQLKMLGFIGTFQMLHFYLRSCDGRRVSGKFT